MKNDQLLLRLSDAQAILGLSRSSLYKLVMSGSLRSITIGRSRRIPAQAIDEWVRNRIADQADDYERTGGQIGSKT
jgi:excisionase family DNA binding protein